MATVSINLKGFSSISNKDYNQLNQIFLIINNLLDCNPFSLCFETDLPISQNVSEILEKNGLELQRNDLTTKISFKDASINIETLKNFSTIDDLSLLDLNLAEILKYLVLKNQFSNIYNYLFDCYCSNHDGFTKIIFRHHLENEVLDLLILEGFYYTLTRDNHYVFDMTKVLVTEKDYDSLINTNSIPSAKLFKLMLLYNQYNYIIDFFENNPTESIIEDIYLYKELKDYLSIEESFDIIEIENNVYYFDTALFSILPVS